MSEQTGKFLFLFEDGEITWSNRVTDADKEMCDNGYQDIIDINGENIADPPLTYQDGVWEPLERHASSEHWEELP